VPPRLLFLDVTNHCNMNCPICIANIPGMGFEFNPPLEYFEKVFAIVGQWEPKPRVQLFGGEPTVRDDLFEIIAIAKRHGVLVSVNTNGLKLADEDYCRRMCEANVPLLIGFDGTDPEIYQKLRHTRAPCAKKLQAFANLRKLSSRHHAIVCAVAWGVNDEHMAELLQFIHGYRDVIKRVSLVPLAELWDEGDFEIDRMTTPEDVEHIVDDAFPDEPVEFLPAGFSTLLAPAHKFFSKGTLRFEGVHPNCESGTYFISDGERFRPLSYFLKRPVKELAADFVARAGKVNARLARLDRDKWFQRWRGRLLAVRVFGGLVLRSVRFDRLFRGNPLLGVLRILGGLLIGRSMKTQVRKHTYAHDSILCLVLPFEEIHSIEAERLTRCPVGFCYLDPETDDVKTVPFCAWSLYRKDTYRRITEKHGTAAKPAALPA